MSDIFAKDMPIKELFKKEAETAHLNFPKSLRKLVVITPQEHIYLSPVVADILTESVNGSVPIINQIISERAALFNKVAHAEAVVSQNYKGTGLHVVALKTLESRFSTKKYDQKMRSIDTYNHEMGHILVRNGSAQKGNESIEVKHIAECAAEAFKALRHIQLFGTETDFFKANNFSHAIVEGFSPIHFMNITLEKVQKISKEQDISSLSFKDIVDLAGDIAEKYHLSEEKLNRVSNAFKPVGDYYNNEGQDTEEGAIRCIKAMLEHKNDHDIYRAGKCYLSHPEVQSSIDKTDPFWVKIFNDMAKFEKEKGLILNSAEALDAEISSKKSPIKNQLK